MAKPPEGSQDEPGFIALPRFSELLFCGNQRSPLQSFGTVLSTTVPQDRDGVSHPELSTEMLQMEDRHGTESAEESELAKRYFIRGAGLVAASVRRQRRTLVHCEWGQNRSGSICCAYAVLCGGWSANDAVEYFREQNKAQRHYSGQYPMHNEAFNRLIKLLEDDRAAIVAAHELLQPQSPPGLRGCLSQCASGVAKVIRRPAALQD